MAARRPAQPIARQEADERHLVEAAQKEPAHFGPLYEMHFERVYAFLAGRVRDRHTAEDLTAEVFNKALAGLRGFQWRGAPFIAWLLRIAANVLADHAKRMAREAPEIAEPPDSAEQPDLAEIEHRARLFRLVNELPNEQRRVIFERFVEQLSIRDIARGLGRTEGAVKQLQFRALRNLRARMEAADA